MPYSQNLLITIAATITTTTITTTATAYAAAAPLGWLGSFSGSISTAFSYDAFQVLECPAAQLFDLLDTPQPLALISKGHLRRLVEKHRP